VIVGLARRFYDAVAARYGAPLWAVKGPEPRVAEELLTAMLDRAGVDVRLEPPTLREPAARGQTLQHRLTDLADGAVYVDASYEGDLMAALGVPYAVGRESRELYGETWAGRQPAYRPSRHNFQVLLSPFGDDGSLLPHVREPELDERGWPAERLGEADGGLQAYGFRVCLTHDPDNALPLEPPDDYDEGEFELAARYLDASRDRAPLGLARDLLPNAKCDVNSIGPFSLNLLDGSNRDYLDGDRAAVRAHHLRYTQAFLFFLSERGLLEGWGLAADEFADTGAWPHQLYVRDARRMLGEHVLTERDLVDARPHPDTVALGSYNIDIREVERTWRYLPEYVRTPAVFNEGYLSVAVPPYPIPYRSLVPAREHATNLLVPVCLSASHVAFGSVRMEPTLMMLGEAAGAAAAQAARRGIAVQDVDVAGLRPAVAA
jgi:FAD dependent oxidoreductase